MDNRFVIGQLVFWKYCGEFYLGSVKDMRNNKYIVTLKCKNYRTDTYYYEDFEVEENELYAIKFKNIKYVGSTFVPVM